MTNAPTFTQTYERVAAADWDINYDSTGSVTIDGREYECKTETDQHLSIFDEEGEGVWCGRLEWSDTRNYYGYVTRPEGFDGSAEILRKDRGSVLWWQPPSDCAKPGSEERRTLRSVVSDHYEYGYVVCVVDGPDGDACLGGIGAMDTEGHRGAFKDMVAELHHAWLTDRWEQQWTASDLERALHDNEFLVSV